MNELRRRLLPLFMALLVCSSTVAQRHRGRLTPERFQAELEQYITSKAGLTPSEASRFFPVYSEMMKKHRALHEKIKSLKRIKPVSEIECKKNIQSRDKLEIEIRQLQKTYHAKFMQMLPASKVYDILKAEDQFHRQAFRRMADRMHKRRK